MIPKMWSWHTYNNSCQVFDFFYKINISLFLLLVTFVEYNDNFSQLLPTNN